MRCKVCNRLLKSEKSIKKCVGPSCAKGKSKKNKANLNQIKIEFKNGN